MVIAIIVLVLIIITLVLMILYLSAYNRLSEINYKIKESDNNIQKMLEEKHELMDELSEKIRKVCRKKDYLKDYNDIDASRLNSRELDEELSKSFTLMLSIQDDHKSLKNDEFNDVVKRIKKLDQKILANKKFFNKNNNQLIKALKGYYKYVAKMTKINVKNSYEIKKEPIED